MNEDGSLFDTAEGSGVEELPCQKAGMATIDTGEYFYTSPLVHFGCLRQLLSAFPLLWHVCINFV